MTSVVLVHGIRTSSSMWRGQGRALTERGIAHLAIDLPGHGSRADEPMTRRGARDAIDAAVASRPGPSVVVGLSLGSYVALDWADQPGSEPAALVLASCGMRPRGAPLQGYLALARLIQRLPDHGLRLHTLLARRVLAPSAAADVLDGGAAIDAMVPSLRAVAAIDVEAALARTRVPVWFVNGTRDHFRLEERRLLRAAPRSTLVHVRGAGHLVALDRPAAFADVVQTVVRQAALTAA